MEKVIKCLTISLFVSNFLYANEIKKVDTVTVVANKIEENIQFIPQSITVIDSVEWQEKGIKKIEDIISQIPNMSSIPDRGVKVSFRGLNASLFTENNPVIVYIDGLPIYSKRSYLTSLENVKRVEVLRGPQGTLYGKDSIGGVINIITKEPSDEFKANIGLEYGSNNYSKGRFNLNIPIFSDKFYLNLNGDLSSDDGWITNTYNNDEKVAKSKNSSIQTSLYYKATDKLSFKINLQKERNKEYGFKGYGLTPTAVFTSQSVFPKFSDFKRQNAEKHASEIQTYEENNISSQALNINYIDDDFSFDSITIHRKTDLEGKYDGDYTNGTYLDKSYLFSHEKVDNYSQEFRISNNKKDSVRWLAGLYLDREKQEFGPYGTHQIVYGTFQGENNMKSKNKNDTLALFTQTMIPLNKNFDLTLGLRYQKIKKDIDFEHYMNNQKFFDYKTKKTWNKLIPKIALDYKIDDNLNSYFSISEGYMAGGFNTAATGSSIDENTFKPQQSINYEAGIKGRFENFDFSASLFRMNIKDIHVYRRLSTGQIFTDNAQKAHSQGLEFDFHYFPTSSIEVSGAFGLIKTNYDSYSVGDYDFTGNKIETTPSHTINLSVAYNNPNGFYIRTDLRNQGSMYFYDDLNKSFVKENTYTLVDSKIGYRFSDWNVYAYGKNLTDKEYVNMYESNSYFSRVTFGEPRTFGIGAKYSF